MNIFWKKSKSQLNTIITPDNLALPINNQTAHAHDKFCISSLSVPEYKLFHNSKDSIKGILDLLNSAKTQIEFEAFYFLSDKVGRVILDTLIEKARSGVKIRLLVDSMGSFSLNQSLFIEAIQHAGGHIRFFNSLIPFSKSNKTFWYFRNHRRSIIVDEQELFVGSFCIGEPTENWRETCILIKNSSAVAQANKVFKDTWHKTSHATFKIGSSSKISTDCFSYITQAPLQHQRHIYKSLINDIRKAEKNILLVAPYIVPDRKLQRALKCARNKNVKIQIITPRKTDSVLADLGRNTYISWFLHKKIDIYFTDEIIHSKVCVFDNKKAYIGTFNLDNVSFRYNYESTIIMDSLNCITDLKSSFQDILMDISLCVNIQNWEKRSFRLKILEILIWPFRTFL